MHYRTAVPLVLAASLFATALPASAEQRIELAQIYPVNPGYGVYGPPARLYILRRHEVDAVVRSIGLRPIDRPRRRGPVYLVEAVSPRGDPARVVVDRYSGEILEVTRFGPSYPAAGPDVRYEGPRVIGRAPEVTGSLASRSDPRDEAVSRGVRSRIDVKPSPDLRRAAPLPQPRPADAPAIARHDEAPLASGADTAGPAQEPPAEKKIDDDRAVDWPPVQPLE